MRFVKLLLLAALLVYLGSGAWPPVPVFGDGLAIANGAEQIKRSEVGPNPLTYSYSQHSGSYVLTAAVSSVTGLTTTTSLLMLCAVAAFAAVFCSAAFVAHVLGVSYPLSLASVLLFQEAYSAAYYGNSTVLASAFAFAALLLLVRGRGVLADVAAGLAFAAAGFMRLDAVLVAPSGVALILLDGRGGAPRRLAVVGIVAAVSLGVALALSGFSAEEVRSALAFKEALFDAGRDFENTTRSLIAFFSVLSVLLTASGSVVLLRTGRRDLLVLVAAGVVPTAILYWGGLDTPRYLYYILPFVALLAASGLRHAWPPRNPLAYGWTVLLAVAFAGQYFFSYPLVKPESSERGAVLATFPTADERGRVRAVMAAPALGLPPLIEVANNGGRLGSGIVMAPSWHRDTRQKTVARLDSLGRLLPDPRGGDQRVITLDWTRSQFVIRQLLKAGWNCEVTNVIQACTGSNTSSGTTGAASFSPGISIP